MISLLRPLKYVNLKNEKLYLFIFFVKSVDEMDFIGYNKGV